MTLSAIAAQKFERCRLDFPFFRHHPDLIYLDSAATTHKPEYVLQCMNDFYEKSYATVHRSTYPLSESATADFHRARKCIQAFLNAKSEQEILFTRGTTASINLVAHSLARSFFKPKGRILLSEIEHHANIVPWQMAAAISGALLQPLRVNDQGELLLEEYEKELARADVQLVSLSHMSNVLGTVQQVKEIVQLAHRYGAYVCLDGAQAIAHESVDVQDIGCDFYAFSGHKLYGPTGIGVLYGKRALLEGMPPIEGGGDMIEEVTFAKSSYGPLPRKFEAGTPMIAEALGLKAAIDYVSSIGSAEIAAWERGLVEYAEQQLLLIDGLKIYGRAPARGPILSFLIDGVHPLDLGALLGARGICVRTGHHCSQPTMARMGCSGMVRISFGLYNSYAEVDRFVEGLKISRKAL